MKEEKTIANQTFFFLVKGTKANVLKIPSLDLLVELQSMNESNETSKARKVVPKEETSIRQHEILMVVQMPLIKLIHLSFGKLKISIAKNRSEYCKRK